MALFGFGGKKKAPDDPAQDEVRGAAAPDAKAAKAAASAEKLRLKKIRAVKSKFDETVWETALATMQSDIPQFTIIEPDPNVPGGQIPRYVVLGFDLEIVDFFSNKADDDIGSIMSAIKHSMDVIIENRLFDNQLILVIPTPKSLAALEEFEDTFDLKFYVCYVTEQDVVSLETKSPDKEDDFIFVTLPEIRSMLDNQVSVKDLIHGLQVRVGSEGDYGGLSGNETTETRAAEASGEPAPAPETSGLADPEPEADPEPVDTEDVRGAVTEAVSKAGQVSNRLSSQSDEVHDAVPEPVAEQAPPPAPPAQPPAPAQPAAAPVAAAASARSRVDRIRAAAQAAVSQAQQDPQIQQKQHVIQAPQQQQFDTAAMDKYISRQYYSDDLGLEISSQPFDAMFLQSNPYMPFQEVQSETWLDGYVNSLRRDANARLAKLHYENLLLMRHRYMEIIAGHCAEIAKAVSTDDPESRFGFLLAEFEAKKKDALDHLPAMVADYKAEIEKAYEDRLRIETENAANLARASFINRFGKEHERELKDAETELRNNLESEFVNAKAQIMQQRRDEAKRQLDAGITETLKICKDEYTKMMAMERKEYVRLQAVIVDYMNEHMAADEAKLAVDMENQRRNTDVQRIQQESAAAMERARADFEARIAEIKAETERSTRAHENAMAEMTDRHAHAVADMRTSFDETVAHKDAEIQLLRGQLSQSEARMDELTKKYIDLEQTTDAKYKNQIDMVKADRDAWDDRAHRLERLHKYTDKVKLTAVAVGFAACIAIGVIIGCVITAGTARDAVDRQAAISAQEPEMHYYVNGEEVDLEGMVRDQEDQAGTPENDQ